MAWLSSVLCMRVLLGAIPAAAADVPEAALAPIAEAVMRDIAAGSLPGAVVVVGHEGRIVYRRAFGHRSLAPRATPMTVDTIFDLASLTKPIATATAVMQLVEEGRLRLDDPVAKYWPEFAAQGKERITVRDLLTHFSGLRPDLDLSRSWSGYETTIARVVSEKPISARGTTFRYSDVGFLALGELVRRMSGLPLDDYCARRVFAPLGMTETRFRPPTALRARIAPTAYRRGEPLRGVVHDPTAARAGGVAGHAGLFSTADDLARFAEMLLEGGALNGARILEPETVTRMTTPQTPPGTRALRGLGWDIDSPYAARGDLFPVGSFGHTGFTGTSVWIDPSSTSYVILLASSVEPSGRAAVRVLRNELATIVAGALGVAGTSPAVVAQASAPPREASVRSGLEVLAARDFAPLRGMRIGLITNHSGVDPLGRRTIDLLQRAAGVELAAVFSPEHGLNGDADEKVASGTEPDTGLPLYSLYGAVTRPTDAMLEGLDALVFDIQDAGARFYTYITTLGYALEAAARKGLAFYVLDRPNPIGADRVEGPILDPGLESFTGYFSLPVRHGMTVGELARLFDGEKGLGARLTVVPMAGYRRGMWYDETGLPWVDPSPNLRSLTASTLYPGVALAEGANVSVGRGTATPFELIGAPWIDGKALAAYLTSRRIPGVRFEAAEFRPSDDRYRDRRCHGVRIVLTDRRALDSPALGVEILGALWRLHPDRFEIDRTLSLVGSRAVLEAIRHGRDPRAIVQAWREPLARFGRLRAKYLLY
ncbi:MAG TPA: exo-beta-N-acetylmuramidase NamZ domain-containing protein [Myxococcota bacterium]|nr:exo-beta-N-acetylmuramidase NamZ domain-containing protein [Myxococcota bacterium]